MDSASLTAAVVFVVGLLVRDGYELLKRSDRIDTKDVRVFAVVLTSMCIMWPSWFAAGVLTPARLQAPAVVRWAGAAAVLVGTAVAVGGMWQLGGVENIDHLVRTGLFSRIRHPMYLGFTLWILGWCVWMVAPANLLLAPLGIASVLWWRQLEESELALQYGDEFREYRASTWF